jgi:hypothetical protein
MGWLEECLLRKQRTTFREHEHGWRALVSTPRCAFRPSTQSSLTAETAITATCQMSVYNFCRCRSACPAGTQCQSEIGCWWEKERFVSRDECGMPVCSAKRSQTPLQHNDIKQKTNRVCPPRSREAVIPVFLVLNHGKCPTCSASQRC